MDEPVRLGLLLGAILSIAGPWIVRRQAIQMDAFLGYLDTKMSAAIVSFPIPLTALLIFIVALVDGKPKRGEIDALLILVALVTFVGWPLAFLSARSCIAKDRAARRQNPEI
jgi:Ca2+/Na+ antiporter